MGEWNDRWDESHSAFGSLVPLKRICYPHLLQHRALRCAIARRASVFFFDPTHHSLGHPPAPPPPRRRPHNKTHFPLHRLDERLGWFWLWGGEKTLGGGEVILGPIYVS